MEDLKKRRCGERRCEEETEEKVEEEMEEEKLLYHLCRPNTYILIPPSSKDLFVGSGDMKR